MLPPELVDLAREPLPQLLRRRRQRIEKTRDAPEGIALLGEVHGAAPPVDPHEMRNRNAIAEREARKNEVAQAVARALDQRERLGHGKLEERVLALGMQALGDQLDGLQA